MQKLFFLSVVLFCFRNAIAQTPCNSTVPNLPVMNKAQFDLLNAKLAQARDNYQKDSADADNIIWYGRRLAYLAHYEEAIAIFSRGVSLYPKDARFYRHRGHRYLSLRCIDLAIPDFEKAAQLIHNKPDEIEPDGLPNAQNVPTSTLQSNIWYHLGLAYYLKGDYTRALDAYDQCMRVSKNPDMYVATANWRYITLRELKKETEAAQLLETIRPGMPLIENKDYLRILLLYKNQLSAQALKDELLSGGSSLGNASVGFGLGNYYLLKGDRKQAKEVFEKILSGDQWTSFGYIAAEVAMKRLNEKR